MPDHASAADEAPDLDGVLRAIGPRLRALRQQLGATLPQLSAMTRISVSTLSRLESGQRRPSLDHLLPLSRVYQVPLDELVNAPVPGDPRVHSRPITRSGMTFYPLSRRPGGLQAYKQIIPAHWPGCELELQVHEGYEWLYVLSGRLRLLLGEHDIELVAGEVAEFDTHVPHAIANAGEKPVELLSLFGPQGERLHVRAHAAGVPR